MSSRAFWAVRSAPPPLVHKYYPAMSVAVSVCSGVAEISTKPPCNLLFAGLDDNQGVALLHQLRSLHADCLDLQAHNSSTYKLHACLSQGLTQDHK